MTAQITPADSFYLAVEFRRRYPAETNTSGIAGKELEEFSHEIRQTLNWTRLSQDFGVPHPVLARSYSRELLNTSPFPMFEGYSSRLLARRGTPRIFIGRAWPTKWVIRR